MVTDFSAEDKASGIKFCTVVHRRPGQEISRNQPATGKYSLRYDHMKAHCKRHAVREISRGVWT